MELMIERLENVPEIKSNIAEVRVWLLEVTEQFNGLVYTDDQIVEAKADRAKLNKLRKALSDERIRVKKECLKPFEQFEADMKELDQIAGKAISAVDEQVKAYEQKKRSEKLDRISEIWQGIKKPDWLDIGVLYKDSWLNASVTLKSIEAELNERVSQVYNELEALKQCAYSFEAIEEYKRTLNMFKGFEMSRNLERMAELKAKAEQAKTDLADIEPKPIEEVRAEAIQKMQEAKKVTLRFWAELTAEEAAELKEFFTARGIKYGELYA